MCMVSLADAELHLRELAAMAAAGEKLSMARRGKEMAQITPADAPRKRADLGARWALVTAMLRRKYLAGGTAWQMRHEAGR